MVLKHGSNSPKWNAFEMKFAGQTQALKNEADRLKQMSARHRRSRSVTSCYDPSSFGADASAANWQMPDMARLSLNGSSVSPRGGYGLWQQPALTPLRRKNRGVTLDNFSLTLPRHRFVGPSLTRRVACISRFCGNLQRLSAWYRRVLQLTPRFENSWSGSSFGLPFSSCNLLVWCSSILQ